MRYYCCCDVISIHQRHIYTLIGTNFICFLVLLLLFFFLIYYLTYAMPLFHLGVTSPIYTGCYKGIIIEN